MPSPSAPLEAYTASSSHLTATVVRYIETAWGDLDDYRDEAIDAFARQVAPVVAGAQRKIATLTDAYIAAMATEATGATVAPVGIPPAAVSSATIRGVAGREVYGRVGPEVWTALARGDSLESAIKQGLSRAIAAARTDLQLAKTHAVAFVTEKSSHVSGYFRVPDAGACDLCLTAADQTYSRGDLMPIHERCACDVEPAFGDEQRTASDIPPEPDRAVDVAVEQHGELGPVLVEADQQFTGPDDF